MYVGPRTFCNYCPPVTKVEYAFSPYLVGIHNGFTASRETCDNCGNSEADGKLAVDTTPLTSSLLYYREKVDGNGVDSLRPEHVKPFLQENLRWRVVFVSSISVARFQLVSTLT